MILSFFLCALHHFVIHNCIRISGIRAGDLATMAEVTRSQVIMKEVEGRVEELQNLRERCHKSKNPYCFSHGRGWNFYSIIRTEEQLPSPHKVNKDGLEDMVGWLSKCESYFDLDKTPEENKVVMASLMLDEVDCQWYDGLRKGSRDLIAWKTFLEGLRIRGLLKNCKGLLKNWFS